MKRDFWNGIHPLGHEALLDSLKGADFFLLMNKLNKTTPLYTKDWYIKWVSTIVLLFGIILTANNIYPLNLYVNVVALFGWIIVSIMWNDRALIVINVVGLTVYLNGIVSYLMK
jgi:hypothetical protein